MAKKRGRKKKKNSAARSSSSPSTSIARHFFKVYLPNLSSRRLKIPRAFLKELGGPPPQNIILKSSLGRFRELGLLKVGDDIYFEAGWHDFVKDHALQLGDFLVFEHEGGSLFNVKIFDCSECEKEEVLTDGGAVNIPFKIKEEEQTEAEEDFNEMPVEGEHTQPKSNEEIFKIKEEEPETTKSIESGDDDDDDVFTESLDLSDELEADDVESESFLQTTKARQSLQSPRTINLQKEKWKLTTREDGVTVVHLT